MHSHSTRYREGGPDLIQIDGPHEQRLASVRRDGERLGTMKGGQLSLQAIHFAQGQFPSLLEDAHNQAILQIDLGITSLG